MKIAIQGELGSFSDEAVRTFVPGGKVMPCATSSEVFERVVDVSAGAALIPIENSLAGPVSIHLDLLVKHDVFVEREFRLRIRHCLIAAPGVRIGQVRRVLSHPVALDQCRVFLREHPKMRAEAFYDTAGSVKHVVETASPDAAGISGERAAEVYGGTILARGIEDDKRNFTRFFLIKAGHARTGLTQAGKKGRAQRALPGSGKTSVAFALKNEPGALFKALSVFALRDISLSKIESRPLLGLDGRKGIASEGQPWEYVFFADLLCGPGEAADRALDHLREVAEFVKVLGVYPAG
ncbi:MAG TPA: prephenate dehydratase domain-containing protein [Terriglobales bacterium]|nr:prephenate dehydratase domain-containing protein [Terriglobales bacterium]